VTDNKYIELSRIDISNFASERNGLGYLPWSWAVDQLLRQDGKANWSWLEPITYNETMMVGVEVTAFGKKMTEWLPVMDHRNKAIHNPDVCAINNAQRRCLTKCIALHGIGINIYQGEDLPLAANEAAEDFAKDIRGARSIKELDELSIHIREFTEQYPTKADDLRKAFLERRAALLPGDAAVTKGVDGLKRKLRAVVGAKEEPTNEAPNQGDENGVA